MAYKNLNLTLSEIENIIKEMISSVNGNYRLIPKSNNLYQFEISIPGQEKALLNIFLTKHGTTIEEKVGPNPELSKTLAEQIALKGKKTISITRTFKNIPAELFNEFLGFCEEQEITYKIEKDDKYQTHYKLMNNSMQELTLTYYKTTRSVFLQGKSTRLYDDILLWFSDKLYQNPEEIIQTIIETMEDFKKYKISFKEDLLEKQLQDKIGDIYNDSKILQPPEKKWLKTSFILVNLNIDLPEYYPAIAGSLKVIEGLLRRILLQKCGLASFHRKTGGFEQFNYNESQKIWELKPCYKKSFSSEFASYTEKLFNFYKLERNKLQHNPGVSPREVESKDEARRIFEEILNLLRKVNTLKKELVN